MVTDESLARPGVAIGGPSARSPGPRQLGVETVSASPRRCGPRGARCGSGPRGPLGACWAAGLGGGNEGAGRPLWDPGARAGRAGTCPARGRGSRFARRPRRSHGDERVSLSDPKRRDGRAALAAGPRLPPRLPHGRGEAPRLPACPCPPPLGPRGQDGAPGQEEAGGSCAADIAAVRSRPAPWAPGRARLPGTRRLPRGPQLPPVGAPAASVQREPSWASPV